MSDQRDLLQGHLSTGALLREIFTSSLKDPQTLKKMGVQAALLGTLVVSAFFVKATLDQYVSPKIEQLIGAELIEKSGTCIIGTNQKPPCF